jgi:leucyl-tRNA synthetase
VNAAPGGLAAPRVYDFREIESRWQGMWDNECVSDVSDTPGSAHGTYYVLQSPPHPREDPPLGQPRSASFADALAQYHRSRGRRVLTEYPDRVFGDVQVPDWPERVKGLQRTLGARDGVELIFGCTQIDEARLLTKTLARMDLMTAKAPHMRAMALGVVTGDGHVPMTTPKPDADRYGADTVRCYMIFMGPHEHDLPFSDGQAGGMHRFLSRLWRLAHDLAPHSGAPPRALPGADLELLRKTHQTIEQVTDTMESELHFHVAIAAVMGLVSESLRDRDLLQLATMRFATETAASLLFPFAPHCAADVYHQLTGEHVWETPWPAADAAFVRADEREIIVQVNGKVRDRVRVKCDVSPAELTDVARRRPHVRAHIEGHKIFREVVVPGKLVNFVTR